jgi:hypothetical protein
MNALSLQPASGPAAAPDRPLEGTRRLRQLPQELFDDEDVTDELTDAQVDAMLMPRPLPLPGEAAQAARKAPLRTVDGAGLRWGLVGSLLAWAAVIAAVA